MTRQSFQIKRQHTFNEPFYARIGFHYFSLFFLIKRGNLMPEPFQNIRPDSGSQ